MRTDPFQIVRDFETAVAEYTGAPYVVAVSSCTMALLLACKYCHMRAMNVISNTVEVPARTYVGVPMSIIHAGYDVHFRDWDWNGMYRLTPLPVWDAARLFTEDMYKRAEGDLVCVSFHATKTLGDTQGGAILTNDYVTAEYLKRMRFDGRTEGVPAADDLVEDIGYHCYMSPDVAARLMMHFNVLPRHNLPLPKDEYPFLPSMPAFKNREVNNDG